MMHLTVAMAEVSRGCRGHGMGYPQNMLGIGAGTQWKHQPGVQRVRGKGGQLFLPCSLLPPWQHSGQLSLGSETPARSPLLAEEQGLLWIADLQVPPPPSWFLLSCRHLCQ